MLCAKEEGAKHTYTNPCLAVIYKSAMLFCCLEVLGQRLELRECTHCCAVWYMFAIICLLGGDAEVVNKSSALLSDVFTCLAHGLPMSARGAAASYTVPTITTLRCLMPGNIFARTFDRKIDPECFLLIISVQCRHVRRFIPDVERLYLLTNLLSALCPTTCKVSLCTGPLPPCMWPSTLVALWDWMEQTQILSVERLGYLAINTSRRLIRAIQSEYCHQEPWVCLGQHMMFRLLGRGIGRVPHCRGILVGQRKKMLLSRLQKK